MTLPSRYLSEFVGVIVSGRNLLAIKSIIFGSVRNYFARIRCCLRIKCSSGVLSLLGCMTERLKGMTQLFKGDDQTK